MTVGLDQKDDARAGGAVAAPGEHRLEQGLAGQLLRQHRRKPAPDRHLRRRREGEAGPAGMIVAGADDADLLTAFQRFEQAPFEDSMA